MLTKRNRMALGKEIVQQLEQMQVRPKFFCKRQQHLPIQVKSSQQFQFKF